MRGKECGASAALVSFDARARTEHRDAAVGERIRGAALGYEQRCAGILFQILGVFGECADKEDRVFLLKGDGHKRAVGVARRLDGDGAQRPGRDLRDQGACALRVRGCRNVYVVQRLRCVA
jgi:hypothetical protein